MARTPVDRVLRLVRRDHAVYLSGYARLPSLVAQQVSESATDQGSTFAIADWWAPISGGTLVDQGGGGSERWEVVAGAPGYAIARAMYCFNPRPNAVFGGIPGSLRYSVAGCTEIVRS